MFSSTSRQLIKSQSLHMLFTIIGVLVIYFCIQYRELFSEYIIFFYIGLILWSFITILYAFYTVVSLIGHALPELIHAIKWIGFSMFHFHFKVYKGIATQVAEDEEKKRQIKLAQKEEKDTFLAAMTQDAQKAYAYGTEDGYQNGYDVGFQEGRTRGERFPRDWVR